MSTSKNVRVTTELKPPADVGVYYRLLCMTGPNKGKVYYLTGKRIVIGRGDTADIQIVDTKISREHAELAFADKSYTITDLGASNGIVVNDTKVKQKKLLDSEKIVIGQTVFKFNILEITQSADMVIVDEVEAKGVSRDTAKELLKEIKKSSGKGKIQAKADDETTPKKTKSETKNGSKTIIFAVIIGAVLFILMDNDEAPKKKSKGSGSSSLNDNFSEMMATTNRKQDDPEVKRKLETLIHSGRREFREGNYFRAMEEFRLAKLLSPGNRDATYYENKAKQRLDEEIEKNFDKGNQEYDSKKYQASLVSYCAVVQLIKEYPDDQRYKNAMIKISAVESELGLEKGEVKCFEEKPGDSRN